MVLDRRERFDGYLFAMLLILEPITRFIVDFFRYYESSMTLANLNGVPLSVNQGFSIVLCGLGFYLMGRLRIKAERRRTRKAAQQKRRQEAQPPERL
jgi:prolipoprotein diacylglyceryltransferase